MPRKPCLSEGERMTHDATLAQRRAANPHHSTWLSANAGSGKTSVLTDRVARLLLGGTQPQRILCLTYTKAAALEMQNRLFKRLGAWAMMPEDILRATLQELGPEGGIITDDTLADARRLFARAIETPGGLKIQTIHSFCAGILRRFPLEAEVSPQFSEMDDRMAEMLRAEIVEDMADYLAPEAVAGLAAIYSGEDFGKIAGEIARNRSTFDAPLSEDALREVLGIGPALTRKAVLQSVFLGDEPLWMPRVIATMMVGKVTDIKSAKILAGLDFANPDMGVLTALFKEFLYGETATAPYSAKTDRYPTNDIRTALGNTFDKLRYLMERVEGARPDVLALNAHDSNVALHRFAAAFLPEYARRKQARGWLDFDDLILRARDLLSQSAVAQWVLFRLDGGIDHILVDEAQDTGPDQWRVIELLTQEFTAGQGARDDTRTIFVVGDKKQSIYSFQGADLEKFDTMQAHFATRLEDVNQQMQALDLLYSFRSSPAILGAVDRVMAQASPMGRVEHRAFWSDLPGRVDLWPALPPAPKVEDPEWFTPVDALPPRAASVELAQAIAAEIERMVESGTLIWHKRKLRPLRYGDVLILVQRRSQMFNQVIRACKERGLPIAGADRLKLGAELAVKDLTALLAFLDTPEDDLSLAALLRSPLFGWTEAELYDLAHPRPPKVFLWQALRDQPQHQETIDVLTDLQRVADYLRPYEVIDRMLTRHDGRRRLIARLGPEAEDGIDQFLALAVSYERMDVPSLTGFLAFLAADEVEVKRQSDSASDRIRVMTVHGAKGLEAPVVILPDTADHDPKERDTIIRLQNGTPVWKPAKDAIPAQIQAALDAAKQRRQAENDRLLYVAMTRAESWLIVAAAGKADKPEGWHNQIAAGLLAAGAAPLDTPVGTGLRLSQGEWPQPTAAQADTTAAPLAPMPLPDWIMAQVPQPPRPVAPINPSDLGGAKALAGELADFDIDTALARGSALHMLLEILPQHPREDWPDLAQRLSPDWAAELLPEARRVLDAPELAPVFAPESLAEVDIRAQFGPREMVGTLDRLIVGADRVLVVDYKSNKVVPQTPDQVPEGLLRQMAAYGLALAPIYPNHQIDCALLWTQTAQLMILPQDLLKMAADRAGLLIDSP